MKEMKIKERPLTIKVAVTKDYENVLNFYSERTTLTKLINALLDECKRDKSFKFKILKKIQKQK